MLTALENGVKGGRWFSLIDKVYAPANLQAAWKQVARNKGAAGVDGQSVVDFSKQADTSLQWLHEQLRTGQLVPSAVKRTWIPKAGSDQLRPLGIPTVRDRIVQAALKNVLEPIFEKEFVEHSYGFRPNRSAKDALRRVSTLLEQGYTHVVDADIEAYFDRIDHDLLKQAVAKRIGDGKVLAWIDAYLQQQVMEGTKSWKSTMGTPQGAVLSPVLANLYLHPVDVALRAEGIEMVRYADDLVLLCRSAEAAQAALARLQELMSGLKLTLHPTKTRVVDIREPGGFDFLGYHFEQGRKWPRPKSWAKFRENVRALTPRNSGRSYRVLIETLNRMLRGWFEYFKHSHKVTFSIADGFVRRRLRAILSRRHGKSHCFGDGAAHQRWPNHYFAELGLFCCVAAHASACHA